MSDRISRVLLQPRESEKAVLVGEKYNQYVFRVVPDATCAEVRKAVERFFDVRVRGVNLLNVKGKVRKRLSGTLSRKANWKKAYVSLETGSQIDFAS